MTADRYPSVTIVAGDIEEPLLPPIESGHMLRMHDHFIYIQITPDVARQWIGVLETIAKESN